MDFPEFAVNHGSQRELVLIIFVVLGHHYQGLAQNCSLQTFPIDLLVKQACHFVKMLHKYNGLRMN